MRSLNIKACSMTVDIPTSSRGLDLFKQTDRDIILNFLGIHPEFATYRNCARFETIVDDNRKFIDGIGEIGLDRSFCESGEKYSEQEKVFKQMLSIASGLKKPISVHSRASLDDVLDNLATFNNLSTCLHWFDGTEKQLERAMNMKLYVSYGPTVVYSKRKKKLLRLTDAEKILIETDGPVRYHACFEEVTSFPTSMLPSVINSISQELAISFEETSALIERNSSKYLDK
jgi:TatD DNase family protein